ncbi:MAG: hypothetical protein HN867_17675 [Deltaproteobacteria bacterium]|nr:hypothetical protein [Deltaproteobacteria bacterium]MBT7205295.1 hypothetical protein [Deltaproteobacteria bacterium]
MLRLCFAILALILPFFCTFTKPLSSKTTELARGLHNPRGIVPVATGSLIILEAGTGKTLDGLDSGKISWWRDLNKDDQFDASEESRLREDLYSYNIMEVFNPGRDEVVGPGDGLLRNDHTLIYTRDSGRETTEIVQMDLVDFVEVVLIERPGVVNSITLSSDQQSLYLAESTLNQIGAYHFASGYEEILLFDVLGHQQQAVPTGLALDSEGNLLVALFSGQLWAYFGETISFMPGDAKIARVDLKTRTYEYLIEGLTTAIDVATHNNGNVYFLELTTAWPTNLISRDFDLHDKHSPPDPGGYVRNSGRLSVLLDGSKESRVLVEGLDLPTNLSILDHQLYISTGQGTPGRRVWSQQGLSEIDGKILNYEIHQ